LPVRKAAGAADQLDHDVDVGRRGERERIAFPAHAGHIDVTLLASAARADRNELEGTAATQRQQSIVLGHQLDDARTHGTEPGDADLERRIHGAA
jgi:hypothetical protein